MAEEGIFCTTTEVERKAGANASSVSKALDYTNQYIAEAESEINAATRFNWSDVYSGLDEDLRDLLKQVASDLAAIKVIQYDMSGFTSRTEAESMVNILRDSALRGLGILRDKKTKVFINGT